MVHGGVWWLRVMDNDNDNDVGIEGGQAGHRKRL
jgi:hypothetical protein